MLKSSLSRKDGNTPVNAVTLRNGDSLEFFQMKTSLTHNTHPGPSDGVSFLSRSLSHTLSLSLPPSLPLPLVVLTDFRYLLIVNKFLSLSRSRSLRLSLSPAVLAPAPDAVMLADAGAPAVLALAPAAVMLADAGAPAVLGLAPLPVVLALPAPPLRCAHPLRLPPPFQTVSPPRRRPAAPLPPRGTGGTCPAASRACAPAAPPLRAARPLCHPHHDRATTPGESERPGPGLPRETGGAFQGRRHASGGGAPLKRTTGCAQCGHLGVLLPGSAHAEWKGLQVHWAQQRKCLCIEWFDVDSFDEVT